MAHLPDGVLSSPILGVGLLVTFCGCAVALRRLSPERVPEVGLMASAFLVASLVHFPVGPGSAHLLLNGLLGVTLGWLAFPAILAAAIPQAALLGFGGLTALGVNVMNMAVPALVASAVFRLVIRGEGRGEGPSARRLTIAAGLAGGVAVATTGAMVAASLALSGRELIPAAQLIAITHLPVLGIETAVTAAAVPLIARLRPQAVALGAPVPA